MKPRGAIPPVLLYFTACAVIVWACAMVARLNLETWKGLH